RPSPLRCREVMAPCSQGLQDLRHLPRGCPRRHPLRNQRWAEASALPAVRALPCRRLAGREWRGRGAAALLEVLVGFRLLLFLVAAHLTLGHDDLPCAG